MPLPRLVLRPLARTALVALLAAGAAAPSAEAQSAHAHPAPAAEPPAAHPADAMFMRMMIPHHAQALEMASLVAGRTERVAIHRLAERIAVAQRDEIAQMQRWLRERGEAVPPIAPTIPLTADAVASVTLVPSTPSSSGASCTPEHAAMGHCTPAAPSGSVDHAAMGHGATDHSRMPGMLSPEQMADLAAARGDAFDRRFLVYMTGHHEGALTMVRDLFAAPGAAQTTFVYRFATDVDSDQRADIRRMSALLATIPADASAPPIPGRQ